MTIGWSIPLCCRLGAGAGVCVCVCMGPTVADYDAGWPTKLSILESHTWQRVRVRVCAWKTTGRRSDGRIGPVPSISICTGRCVRVRAMFALQHGTTVADDGWLASVLSIS
jgi:hypothetical protein